MQANNIDKKNLEPQYDCKVCNDTGINNGKICDCLLTELNKKISTITSSQSEFKNFAMQNKNLMDENDIKASEWLKMWCSRFPNTTKLNINIMGGAGSGKTFLLECVANEMLNKNMVICYKTAFELNELARLYHIGKSFSFADCLNADILFIDDLGTEVANAFTNSMLYTCINERLLHRKSTIISTNFSLDQLKASSFI